MNTNYYLSHKDKLLRTFGRESRSMRPILSERYEGELADTVLNEARKEFELLIPEIPYIGGSKNPMQSDLIESIHLLALYRVMKAHNKTAQETSEIINRGMKEKLARYPVFLLRMMGKFQFSTLFVKHLQKLAAISQIRKYPGNFVFNVVIGDGKEFDWGLDFTECAIQKFYQNQQAAEFLPYICPNDYITSEAFGLGMIRSQTLVEGAKCCNPRLKKGRLTQRK